MRRSQTTLEPVYRAAEQFVDAALKTDGSLFTPGASIWTRGHVEEFHRLFVENEDRSKNSFNDKLLRQLADAPPPITQLAAELLFFHSLGISNQGPASKRVMIQPLLDRIELELPTDLEPALGDGIANHRAGLAHRDAYMKLLARFMLAWKLLSAEEVSSLLEDPYTFRGFVFDLPEGADAAQRNMLVHLVFPDSFEPIASPYWKQNIVECFVDFVSDTDADVDSELAEIRLALSGKHGSGFSFYDEELQSQWGTVKEAPSTHPSDPVEAISLMVEAIYPDSELRVLLLDFLADAVEKAHSAGPSSWGLGPDSKLTYLNLNVGRLATVTLHAEYVLVTLDQPSLSEQLIAQLDEASERKGGIFVSMPTSKYWKLRADAVPGLIDDIERALSAHIENAAKAVSVTPYARFHSAAASEYVGMATGRDLPSPKHREMPAIPGKSGWDGFVSWAARVFDEERFDEWERDYKLAIAERLRTAQAALLDGSDDWWRLLKTAFTRDNNLTPWQQHSKFYQWAKDEPEAAETALKAIWTEKGDVSERIRAFCDVLPREVVSGTGTRLAIASFLLMSDPAAYPIFRPTPFQDAYRLTGWEGPSDEADEAAMYASALAFMDELRARLADVGVETRDRLDAQGLIWAVVHWNEPPQYLTPEEQERLVRFKTGKVDSTPEHSEVDPEASHVTDAGYTEPSFDEILEHFEANGFRIDADTLLRYHLSLKTRGFVILSGVSGTGKSWLTRLYAKAVSGEFRLVPVAPNWTTNEDLLGFHNPVMDKYVDTDFSRFLRLAVEEQERADKAGTTPRPYFVVLDEMNLARVEYYFAKFLSVMEARGQEGVTIELSESERLPLPSNLFTVGTVNVDETTHGFADKVYDRAQVIELPITEKDLEEHVGGVVHGALLMAVWRAVQPVAPFAYRVADEVALYVAEAEEAGLEWERALDHQVLQKILPKLARADDRVGEVLLQVQEVCGEVLPLSSTKAAGMHRHLEDHGFASYF